MIEKMQRDLKAVPVKPHQKIAEMPTDGKFVANQGDQTIAEFQLKKTIVEVRQEQMIGVTKFGRKTVAEIQRNSQKMQKDQKVVVELKPGQTVEILQEQTFAGEQYLLRRIERMNRDQRIVEMTRNRGIEESTKRDQHIVGSVLSVESCQNSMHQRPVARLHSFALGYIAQAGSLETVALKDCRERRGHWQVLQMILELEN
jgi:hypothetical protein